MVPNGGPAQAEGSEGYITADEEEQDAHGEAKRDSSISEDLEDKEHLVAMMRRFIEAADRKRAPGARTHAIFTPDNGSKLSSNIKEEKAITTGNTNKKVPMLPTLTGLSSLRKHYRQCEMLIGEEDVDVELFKTKLAMVNSFASFPELKNTADSLVERPWAVLRDTLFKVYCEANFLRAEFEKHLSSLRFDPSRSFEFVCNARALYGQIPAEADRSSFVARILGKLPADIVAPLVREARREDPDCDWRSIHFERLLTLLTDAINTNNAVSEIKATSGISLHAQPVDTAGVMQEGKKPWIEDWYQNLYQQGAVIYKVSTIDNGRVEELRRVALVCKQLRRRLDNSPYYFMAFRSASEAEAALSILKPEEFTVFKPFGSKYK